MVQISSRKAQASSFVFRERRAVQSWSVLSFCQCRIVISPIQRFSVLVWCSRIISRWKRMSTPGLQNFLHKSMRDHSCRGGSVTLPSILQGKIECHPERNEVKSRDLGTFGTFQPQLVRRSFDSLRSLRMTYWAGAVHQFDRLGVDMLRATARVAPTGSIGKWA